MDKTPELMCSLLKQKLCYEPTFILMFRKHKMHQPNLSTTCRSSFCVIWWTVRVGRTAQEVLVFTWRHFLVALKADGRAASDFLQQKLSDKLSLRRQSIQLINNKNLIKCPRLLFTKGRIKWKINTGKNLLPIVQFAVARSRVVYVAKTLSNLAWLCLCNISLWFLSSCAL